MAHYYVVRQKLDKTGAEDKVRYYGVPVTCGRVSTKKLADLVADLCEIGGMILELLKDGYSVELDGLGDFYLSAGSEGFEDPKKCTPHRVKARRVCFRMAPCVRKSMKFVKFERNPW